MMHSQPDMQCCQYERPPSSGLYHFDSDEHDSNWQTSQRLSPCSSHVNGTTESSHIQPSFWSKSNTTSAITMPKKKDSKDDAKVVHDGRNYSWKRRGPRGPTLKAKIPFKECSKNAKTGFWNEEEGDASDGDRDYRNSEYKRPVKRKKTENVPVDLSREVTYFKDVHGNPAYSPDSSVLAFCEKNPELKKILENKPVVVLDRLSERFITKQTNKSGSAVRSSNEFSSEHQPYTSSVSLCCSSSINGEMENKIVSDSWCQTNEHDARLQSGHTTSKSSSHMYDSKTNGDSVLVDPKIMLLSNPLQTACKKGKDASSVTFKMPKNRGMVQSASSHKKSLPKKQIFNLDKLRSKMKGTCLSSNLKKSACSQSSANPASDHSVENCSDDAGGGKSVSHSIESLQSNFKAKLDSLCIPNDIFAPKSNTSCRKEFDESMIIETRNNNDVSELYSTPVLDKMKKLTASLVCNNTPDSDVDILHTSYAKEHKSNKAELPLGTNKKNELKVTICRKFVENSIKYTLSPVSLSQTLSDSSKEKVKNNKQMDKAEESGVMFDFVAEQNNSSIKASDNCHGQFSKDCSFNTSPLQELNINTDVKSRESDVQTLLENELADTQFEHVENSLINKIDKPEILSRNEGKSYLNVEKDSADVEDGEVKDLKEVNVLSNDDTKTDHITADTNERKLKKNNLRENDDSNIEETDTNENKIQFNLSGCKMDEPNWLKVDVRNEQELTEAGFKRDGGKSSEVRVDCPGGQSILQTEVNVCEQKNDDKAERKEITEANQTAFESSVTEADDSEMNQRGKGLDCEKKNSEVTNERDTGVVINEIRETVNQCEIYHEGIDENVGINDMEQNETELEKNETEESKLLVKNVEENESTVLVVQGKQMDKTETKLSTGEETESVENSVVHQKEETEGNNDVDENNKMDLESDSEVVDRKQMEDAKHDDEAEKKHNTENAENCFSCEDKNEIKVSEKHFERLEKEKNVISSDDTEDTETNSKVEEMCEQTNETVSSVERDADHQTEVTVTDVTDSEKSMEFDRDGEENISDKLNQSQVTIVQGEGMLNNKLAGSPLMEDCPPEVDSEKMTDLEALPDVKDKITDKSDKMDSVDDHSQNHPDILDGQASSCMDTVDNQSPKQMDILGDNTSRHVDIVVDHSVRHTDIADSHSPKQMVTTDDQQMDNVSYNSPKQTDIDLSSYETEVVVQHASNNTKVSLDQNEAEMNSITASENTSTLLPQQAKDISTDQQQSTKDKTGVSAFELQNSSNEKAVNDKDGTEVENILSGQKELSSDLSDLVSCQEEADGRPLCVISAVEGAASVMSDKEDVSQDECPETESYKKQGGNPAVSGFSHVYSPTPPPLINISTGQLSGNDSDDKPLPLLCPVAVTHKNEVNLKHEKNKKSSSHNKFILPKPEESENANRLIPGTHCIMSIPLVMRTESDYIKVCSSNRAAVPFSNPQTDSCSLPNQMPVTVSSTNTLSQEPQYIWPTESQSFGHSKEPSVYVNSEHSKNNLNVLTFACSVDPVRSQLKASDHSSLVETSLNKDNIVNKDTSENKDKNVVKDKVLDNSNVLDKDNILNKNEILGKNDVLDKDTTVDDDKILDKDKVLGELNRGRNSSDTDDSEATMIYCDDAGIVKKDLESGVKPVHLTRLSQSYNSDKNIITDDKKLTESQDTLKVTITGLRKKQKMKKLKKQQHKKYLTFSNVSDDKGGENADEEKALTDEQTDNNSSVTPVKNVRGKGSKKKARKRSENKSSPKIKTKTLKKRKSSLEVAIERSLKENHLQTPDPPAKEKCKPGKRRKTKKHLSRQKKKNQNQMEIVMDHAEDLDCEELPTILPPKRLRRRMHCEKGVMHNPLSGSSERIQREFPRHNWLEEKINKLQESSSPQRSASTSPRMAHEGKTASSPEERPSSTQSAENQTGTGRARRKRPVSNKAQKVSNRKVAKLNQREENKDEQDGTEKNLFGCASDDADDRLHIDIPGDSYEVPNKEKVRTTDKSGLNDIRAERSVVNMEADSGYQDSTSSDENFRIMDTSFEHPIDLTIKKHDPFVSSGKLKLSPPVQKVLPQVQHNNETTLAWETKQLIKRKLRVTSDVDEVSGEGHNMPPISFVSPMKITDKNSTGQNVSSKSCCSTSSSSVSPVDVTTDNVVVSTSKMDNSEMLETETIPSLQAIVSPITGSSTNSHVDSSVPAILSNISPVSVSSTLSRSPADTSLVTTQGQDVIVTSRLQDRTIPVDLSAGNETRDPQPSTLIMNDLPSLLPGLSEVTVDTSSNLPTTSLPFCIPHAHNYNKEFQKHLLEFRQLEALVAKKEQERRHIIKLFKQKVQILKNISEQCQKDLANGISTGECDSKADTSDGVNNQSKDTSGVNLSTKTITSESSAVQSTEKTQSASTATENHEEQELQKAQKSSEEVLSAEKRRPIVQMINNAMKEVRQARNNDANFDFILEENLIPAHQNKSKTSFNPDKISPTPFPAVLSSPYIKRTYPVHEPLVQKATTCTHNSPNPAHCQPPFHIAGSLIIPVKEDVIGGKSKRDSQSAEFINNRNSHLQHVSSKNISEVHAGLKDPLKSHLDLSKQSVRGVPTLRRSLQLNSDISYQKSSSATPFLTKADERKKPNFVDLTNENENHVLAQKSNLSESRRNSTESLIQQDLQDALDKQNMQRANIAESRKFAQYGKVTDSQAKSSFCSVPNSYTTFSALNHPVRPPSGTSMPSLISLPPNPNQHVSNTNSSKSQAAFRQNYSSNVRKSSSFQDTSLFNIPKASTEHFFVKNVSRNYPVQNESIGLTSKDPSFGPNRPKDVVQWCVGRNSNSFMPATESLMTSPHQPNLQKIQQVSQAHFLQQQQQQQQQQQGPHQLREVQCHPSAVGYYPPHPADRMVDSQQFQPPLVRMNGSQQAPAFSPVVLTPQGNVFVQDGRGQPTVSGSKQHNPLLHLHTPQPGPPNTAGVSLPMSVPNSKQMSAVVQQQQYQLAANRSWQNTGSTDHVQHLPQPHPLHQSPRIQQPQQLPPAHRPSSIQQQIQQNSCQCIVCGAHAIFLCSCCKRVWYCSKPCQDSHWTQHAPDCRSYGGASSEVS